MFALDLLFWCVTSLSLLTLVCSTALVVYLGARKLFVMVFAIPVPGARLARSALSGDLPTSPSARMIVAVVDRNFGAVRRGIEAPNAAAIAGPWGPIDGRLSPETTRKIERVMAVGVGMRDAAGNVCPHPIAPRVALAIVEALQAQQ
jgi:hypothetical protein